MREKFGRQLRRADEYNYDFNSEFAVETYLDHQGQAFVERFDANCYLYITKAMDYFDLTKEYGSLVDAFANTSCRFLVISFASDWLFTPEQSREIVNALVANRKDVSYCDIASPYGHDAFLLEPEILGSFISGFLKATHRPGVRQDYHPDASGRKGLLSQFEQARRTRIDYELIESLIEPNSTVLDIGCGDGELLADLTADKKIKGEGIELQQDLVLNSVSRGLSIIQHDIELGLEDYADKSFDYVILSQTVQTVKNPEKVFKELLRVGKKVVVSFPNFAHWKSRAQLFFTGRAPVTKQLPFSWHNSPNIHFLSLKDFDRFCDELGVKVQEKIPVGKTRISPVSLAPNWFAEQVIYVTSKD
jgi:homoserine O-acetyltransferase